MNEHNKNIRGDPGTSRVLFRSKTGSRQKGFSQKLRQQKPRGLTGPVAAGWIGV
jgi:hypothetical protein